MRCDTTHQGTTSIIHISGRFVFDGHRDFRAAYEEALGRAETKHIQLDLGEVEYLDSSALGMMLLMKDRGDAAGKKIQIRGASDFAYKLLVTTNFHKIFDIQKS